VDVHRPRVAVVLDPEAGDRPGRTPADGDAEPHEIVEERPLGGRHLRDDYSLPPERAEPARAVERAAADARRAVLDPVPGEVSDDGDGLHSPTGSQARAKT